MDVSRRELIRLTTMTIAAGAGGLRAVQGQTPPPAPAPAPAPTAATAPVQTAFSDLRRNVGIFTGQGGTIGWLINSGGVVIVDTQFPATAKTCLEGVRSRASNRAIDLVLNTHHHGDHTGGNGVFREAAKKIVAHARVPELQKAAAERQAASPQAASQPPHPQTYADTTFTDTWHADVGDEKVSAHYFGPAHTGGDSVIFFERANIVHMGDLMFNRRHPFIDRPGGASIAGWISALERIARHHAGDTIFVFGHAAPKFNVTGSKDDLMVQRDYFTALLEYVRGEIKAGRSREELVKSSTVLKGFSDHGPLIERVLGAAYEEVSASA
jgi:cyclase